MAVAPYLRVADDLRRKILSGELVPGAELPSRQQLQRIYAVGGYAADNARRLLIAEGLAEGRPGSGTVVRERPKLHRIARSHYGEPGGGSPFAAEQRAAGREPGWTVDSQTASAPPAIAERLGIEPGDPVMRSAYVFTADSRPVMLSTSWEPLAITGQTPVILPEAGPHKGLGVVDRMATIGITVTEPVEEVTARRALLTEAEQLGGIAGDIVLVIARTYVANDGRAVETADIVIPADRYSLVYHTPIPRSQ